MTLGFGEIIRIVALNWVGLTRGPSGISGIPKPVFFGYQLGKPKAFPSSVSASPCCRFDDLADRAVACRSSLDGDARRRDGGRGHGHPRRASRWAPMPRGRFSRAPWGRSSGTTSTTSLRATSCSWSRSSSCSWSSSAAWATSPAPFWAPSSGWVCRSGSGTSPSSRTTPRCAGSPWGWSSSSSWSSVRRASRVASGGAGDQAATARARLNRNGRCVR